MAGENKLILMNVGGVNTLTDIELASTDWDSSGIYSNEIAYSNRMNAVLRQVTTVTHSLAGLIADELDLIIGSYEDAGNSIVTITPARIKATIKDIVLENAVDKNAAIVNNVVWAGPEEAGSDAPEFRLLVPADIPDLDAAKIVSGEFGTVRIANLAITTEKLNTYAVTSGKIANANVTTSKIADNNVTFGKIQEISGLSILGRADDNTGETEMITAGTDGQVLLRSGTALIFGQIVAAGIADDAIVTSKILNENITKSKLSKVDVLIGDGTKLLDSLISAKHSSVVSKVGTTQAFAQFTIRKVTQAEFTGLVTKDANTIYIVKG